MHALAPRRPQAASASPSALGSCVAVGSLFCRHPDPPQGRD
ncbi:hypothetical protein APY03_5382 [Variovorax sp. WDL1]|nr:hypothetical protein APY03_5382 [Variovorax sp. WDL1]